MERDEKRGQGRKQGRMNRKDCRLTRRGLSSRNEQPPDALEPHRRESIAPRKTRARNKRKRQKGRRRRLSAKWEPRDTRCDRSNAPRHSRRGIIDSPNSIGLGMPRKSAGNGETTEENPLI